MNDRFHPNNDPEASTPAIDSMASKRDDQVEAAAQLGAIGGEPLAGSGFEEEEYEEGFL